MNSSRTARGTALVFLFVVVIVSLASSGCAGSVSSAPAPVSTPPPVAGTPQLSVNPNSIVVNASVGVMGSQAVSASNTGTAALNVSQIQVSGAGFAVTGLTAPLSLAPGASQNFTVTFDATASGSVDGTLSLMTNASASPILIPLHGSASALVSSIAISPAAPQAIVGSTLPFSASIHGTTTNTAVTWQASRGTITAAGVYTAPATTGTDTVTATSVADGTKSASATVAVIATPSTPTVTSVTVSPVSTSLVTGGSVQFSATVQGTVTNKSVTWAAASGVITAAGVYTAPTTVGTDTITVTSNADKAKSASATVTIAAPVVNSVNISPATASAVTGGTAQFSASISGTVSDKSVTWKAASGSITAAGLYTAPTKAGSDTVTATSNADSTKAATAAVTVADPVINSVSVSPGTTSLTTGGTAQFTASVSGTNPNKAVTWKAALGTITAAGAYTAPTSAGTDTITATSAADTTKSGTASVTVSTPTVNSVSITPSSASVTTGGTLQFSASVSGSVSNKSVTWSAASGTISAGGVYVAPNQVLTDKVTATSDADNAKSATATVKVSAPASNGAVAAFPGAQGGGAASVGGRGGQVIEVTNLNDSGGGSLRNCISQSGPRTCVFRVAGIITPQSMLRLDNPYITIACQTAPGEVIIGGPDSGQDSLFVTTHDVIVRYCTFSSDNINISAGPDTGTMNVEIANGDDYNIIFDHITTRWASNKLWAAVSNYVGPNRLITTQWSMFYEPHVSHPVGPGTGTNPGCSATSSSPCFSAGEHDIDFHHNLFANMNHRIPENVNYSTRWTNNIVFNWGYYASAWLGAMHVDEIGNKYVAGNLNSNAQHKEMHFTTNSAPLPGNPSVYLSGNIGPNQSNPNGDQSVLANEIDGENGNEVGPLPSSWMRNGPMSDPTFPIVADSASNLDGVLLPSVGNSQHVDCSGNWVSHRDSADSRVINQYKNQGSGGFWPNGVVDAGSFSVPNPTSNWTDQPVTGFSACTESLHDGIPDQWKSNQGLSTTDPNLYKTIAPNGYTYLENYLNGNQ
jgi:hypothetical protein